MPTPVRIKSVRASSGSTAQTVTFDEGTALDSTHLLVAVVQWSSNVDVTTPSGWTAAAGSGRRDPFNYTAVFTRQGDGSVNSFTITGGTGSRRALTLMGFDGFTSASALASQSGLQYPSPATVTPPSTPAGYGVVVALGGTPNTPSASWTGWTNGFTDAATGDYLSVALKTYDSETAETYSSSLSWTYPEEVRWMSSILPLTNPTPPATVSYALGSTPRTLALGSTPVEAWKGAGAP